VATFEIGSQNAASIQNVGGDLTIQDLHVEATWSTIEMRQELARLQEEIARVALPPDLRATARAAVGAAAAEAGRPAPDHGRMAQLLGEATTLAGEAGALTSAGSGLVESLRRTATILGPAGKTLLALLPLL
jgi:hypothetical protein